MVNETEHSGTSPRIVVRLLNSVLRGCEFVLDSGTTLFIVSERENIHAQSSGTVLPENMIFVPMEQGGVSFEAVVKNNENEKSSLTLRELKPDGNIENTVNLNEVIHIGTLDLAARFEHDTWSQDILNHSVAGIKNTPKPMEKKKGWFWIGVILLLLTLCITVWGYTYFNSQQRKILEISSLLGYKKDQYQYLQGRDKITYILANDEKSMYWAQQALVRNLPSSSVKVVNIPAEELRISLWLNEHWPSLKFHRIYLSNPTEPVVLLSYERGRLDNTQKNRLSELLKKEIPYADSIVFNQMKDSLVAKEAEQGLSKMSIVFSENKNVDSVTFVIRGEMDDSELQRIKTFVQSYYQLWGGQYVQFSIELNNDWLKGKSFKYGDQGYVKVSPSHWYFPKPLSLNEK
ncbi:PrgH/EprH family type III secretion apparatus protein [Yersinia nurmii]|uniref:PrgH/EprH family type III secretion apparatus protein n=1 Tax=Yersinia nurmii TaxID=685706 RepID=A0AAW7JWV1_9GAMM|nr:PrgH/EprH family type III secretion apparatus protein [Yersinia nurmii]MDN0086156.1 PrgH/EprH family type III secretion apparatus protein [Yersinia nurmii]CND83112.1 type III secretion system needle complex protein PrgH [Yersinia nurmii]